MKLFPAAVGDAAANANPSDGAVQTFPLTAPQQDIWLDQLSRSDSPLYNIGGYVELTGPVSPSIIERAVQLLVATHDALRTVLVTDGAADGLPRQTFAPQMPVQVPLHDFSLQPDPLGAAQAFMQQQMEQPYALDGGPLFRFFLVRLDATHHLLGTQAHHLVLDGWGFGQMLQSLGSLYSALAQGRQPDLSAASYVEFIGDDVRYRDSARYARDRAYWLDKYQSIPEPLLIPRYRDRHVKGSAPSNTLVLPFPTALHERMKHWAKTRQASAFHVLLAAMHVYFTRTAQRDEWVVGVPILNRSNAWFRSTLGLFTQVSAVRLALHRDLSFGQLVRAVRDELKHDFRHQRFPLSEMNRALGLLRDGRAQLFDVSVSYEQDDHDYRYGEARAHAVKVSNGHESMPLSIHLRTNSYNDKVWIHYVYNEAYFERSEVGALAGRILHVLEQGLQDAELAPGDFALMTGAETQQLQQWNATDVAFPQGQTLHARFEAQAASNPDALAAVYQGQRLTYGELNQRANPLAHHLRELGVQPDDRVAIVARRGLDALVALVAILKSGACYVPIDPSHPAERLSYLLSDSAPVAVLTQANVLERLPTLDVPLLNLDSPLWQGNAVDNPQPQGLTTNLAYVIYTSGSTGLPKGVMVEHQTVANLVDWHCEAFKLHQGSHTSSLAGFGFDAMAWEVWPALCAGATLHLPPAHDGSEDIDALLDWWRAQPLDVSFLPTPVAEYAFSQNIQHPTLHTLLIGGDRLRQFAQAQSFEVINNYGPTEATVVATSGPVAVGQVLHIGKPMANARVYLLDEQQRPVPIGVAGELYVGGAGVARGYLNRPDLTAERFLPDPFNAEPHARMYRTGDLARWLADGNIEYLGRNDDQVKIRGVRIEVGEVEAGLATHEAVKEAVVHVRDGRLVAYFTEHQPLDIQHLQAHLQTRLPDYMLPSAYVRLDTLPLTANGKLDRKALPAPGLGAVISRAYEAPQGEIETTLAQIWADVLQVERVGRQDHFFELGGHSLLAVGLVERMRQMGLSANVRVLFGQPTLAALAAAVGDDREVQVPGNRIPAGCTRITPDMLALATLDQAAIERVVAGVPGGAANVQEIYPLAPLQEGLLYHHMTAEQGDPYQQHAIFAFDSRERLQGFATALQAVISRHDILRTSLVWDGIEQPMQVVWRHAPLTVETIALNPEAGDIVGQLRQQFDSQRSPLDIRQAPMMRLACAEDQPNKRWVGMLRFHHLVNDATSTAVLLTEIEAHLLGEQQHLRASVPYRRYVAQARLANRQQEHEAFFRDALGDIHEPTLAFGLQGLPGNSVREETGGILQDALNQRLRVQARQLGVSPASLCHLAWAQVLGRLSGKDDVVFGTVLLGRLQAGEGADRALGMFINTLPLRVALGEQSVVAAVNSTHERLSTLLAHEHAPLALAQRCSGIAVTTPLFNALLNYRHLAASAGERHASAWQGIEQLESPEIASYPLMLSVDDLGDGFRLGAQAPSEVGAQRVFDYMHTALEGLVAALEQAPQTPVCNVPVLPAAECERLLVTLNATHQDTAGEALVHRLFEARVEQVPEAIALFHDGQGLSYRQLNERANQLAHYLIAQGVRPDSRVGICVERSPEMVVGLLAILKAGGAYVPIDPAYPHERITYMLQDSAPAAVLVHGATAALLADTVTPVVNLDNGTWQDQPLNNPEVTELNASHLAYVIYTSGSTGQPKGVMVEHHGVANMLGWYLDDVQLKCSDAVLVLTSHSFDLTQKNIFGCLAAGATLHLADTPFDPISIVRQIHERQITFINLAPSAFYALIDVDETSALSGLRCVVLGGEPIKLAQLQKLAEPRPLFINSYGPTECSDVAGWHRVAADFGVYPSGDIPLGRPIRNLKLYVLDSHAQLVPTGCVGELYIGGEGVARGYLNRDELTAERFLPDPFNTGSQARLYRTGDLVRYLADGTLEYLGRNDDQVKIRGLRIELGEIEARLVAHPDVAEAVVLARNERLLAYFIAATVEGQGPSAEQLRTHLLAQLPDYMVPSAFVRLDALPLNPNGKLDRKALPTPGLSSMVTRGYEAPQGEVETTLAQIWGDVLKIERVGRHDHFFELGGHSLLAVNLVQRMRQAGLSADARTLFSQPTLSALAATTVALVQHLDAPATTIPTLKRKRRL